MNRAYEVWHRPTANWLQSFPTEAEAWEFVRRQPSHRRGELSIGWEDENEDWHTIKVPETPGDWDAAFAPLGARG